jgi:hypothetical protein
MAGFRCPRLLGGAARSESPERLQMKRAGRIHVVCCVFHMILFVVDEADHIGCRCRVCHLDGIHGSLMK